MPPLLLILVYCVLIVVASLGGAWLPTAVRLTHARMQILMSGVAGLMLGVGLFHMLPHSFEQTRSIHQTMLWVMIGLLAMFFLIRAFHFHQHDVALPEDEHGGHDHDHDHDHDHSHDHHHMHSHAHSHAEPMSHARWLGVAVGLSLHTLIDGIALAAGVEHDAKQEVGWPLYGLGVFLAILLHKPLDAMSISSMMQMQGIRPIWRQVVNAGFAAMCPIGAILFVLGLSHFGEQQGIILGCALGFAAGVFLCISLGDLLPELQFHEHDRLKLSAALLIGVAIAYAIGALEPAHVHTTSSNRDRRQPIDQDLKSAEFYEQKLLENDFEWYGPTSNGFAIPTHHAARALSYIGDDAVFALLRSLGNPEVDSMSIYRALSEIGIPVHNFENEILNHNPTPVIEWWNENREKTVRQRSMHRVQIGLPPIGE